MEIHPPKIKHHILKNLSTSPKDPKGMSEYRKKMIIIDSKAKLPVSTQNPAFQTPQKHPMAEPTPSIAGIWPLYPLVQPQPFHSTPERTKSKRSYPQRKTLTSKKAAAYQLTPSTSYLAHHMLNQTQLLTKRGKLQKVLGQFATPQAKQPKKFKLAADHSDATAGKTQHLLLESMRGEVSNSVLDGGHLPALASKNIQWVYYNVVFLKVKRSLPLVNTFYVSLISLPSLI